MSTHTCDLLFQDKSLQFKVQRPQILAAIETTLSRHFEEERQIDLKAESLYQDQASTMGSVEKGKALNMIRQQLAQEKQFVLSGGREGRFSADKISHIAHLVSDKLYDDDLMDFPDEDDGPQWFKKVFNLYFQRENELDDRVRKKIQSLANAPFEGSREWEVLFRKYREEEMRKIGHG